MNLKTWMRLEGYVGFLLKLQTSESFINCNKYLQVQMRWTISFPYYEAFSDCKLLLKFAFFDNNK